MNEFCLHLLARCRLYPVWKIDNKLYTVGSLNCVGVEHSMQKDDTKQGVEFYLTHLKKILQNTVMIQVVCLLTIYRCRHDLQHQFTILACVYNVYIRISVNCNFAWTIIFRDLDFYGNMKTRLVFIYGYAVFY